MDRSIERDKARALMDEIIAVCRKHGLWLSHEDCHGSFLIERESTEEWLNAAVKYSTRGHEETRP